MAASPARAYRAPRNPRYKLRGAAVSTPTAKIEVDPIPRLAPGRWKPEVKFALELFAAEHGKDSREYNPAAPPVATLTFDDAAIAGDLGEFVFERLVERAEFRFDDEWWKLVPLAYGRQKIRAAHEQFIDMPRTVWDAQPAYHQYEKFMIASYLDLCRKVSRKDCRIYIARLLKGFGREESAAYAAKVFTDEEIAPVGEREFRESPEDKNPVKLRRGLRELPEMKDLALLLLKAGFEVWIVDAEAQPLLSVYAASYGLDPAKAVGIRLSAFGLTNTDLKFTGRVEEPVPARSGKVDAVVAAVGRAPVLVVGASDDDRELLDYGAGLRLLLDHGDKPLRAYAERRGWLVQPAFTP